MGARRCAAACAALLLLSAPAAAQFLPDTRWFEPPLADPGEPRFAGGLVRTDLLTQRGPERPPFQLDADREVQAAVSLGATLPLWEAARWDGGGVVVAGQGGVSARFRIELPSRDDLAQDWIVAMPVEVRYHDWSGRARIGHRSAHLGDEFIGETSAKRIEFGYEFLELLVARQFAWARVYGGGSWIFRSNTDSEAVLLDADRSDRGMLQAGFELSEGVSVVAVDWQAAERSAWRSRIAAAAGVRFTRGARSISFLLRLHEGPSDIGQFFATDESWWGIEGIIR